jgi:hypothetical protein
MKREQATPTEPAAAGWQLFGETTLAEDSRGELDAWLAETFRPLNLPAAFAGKILTTARQAAARAQQPAPGSRGCIRLQIFLPTPRLSGGQTWGFFQLEKTASTPAGPPVPVVAFYLYQDG